MSPNQEIEQRVQRFVSELIELFRQQAVEAVQQALMGAGAAAGPARRAAAAAAGRSSRRIGDVRPRRKGEKRSAAELQQLEEQLLSYIRGNPGQGIEAIGRSIGMPTSELSRPVKKLIARGALRTQGAKRATRYFAAGSAELESGDSDGDDRRRPGRRRGARRAKR